MRYVAIKFTPANLVYAFVSGIYRFRVPLYQEFIWWKNPFFSNVFDLLWRNQNYSDIRMSKLENRCSHKIRKKNDKSRQAKSLEILFTVINVLLEAY